MRFNEVIEHEVTVDVTTEPVTLDELKRHLNMLFDTDGSYDFSDDDDYLTSIIPQARESLEAYTGLSFAPKTIVAVLRNELGDIEIPYGPITAVASVKDEDDNNVTCKIVGNQFKKIADPWLPYLKVTYTAGYTSLPNALKRAILEEAAFRYSHRGEEVDSAGYCKGSLALAAPFKRTSWLV